MARILIVDDEEPVRLFLSAVLERAGHQTFLAEDGKKALKEYGGTVIDVVITDLRMPNVDGLQLITMLRGLSPRPAIIAISGMGRDALDEAKTVGADATLTKPVDRIELLSAVAMAVGERDDVTRDV